MVLYLKRYNLAPRRPDCNIYMAFKKILGQIFILICILLIKIEYIYVFYHPFIVTERIGDDKEMVRVFMNNS